MQRENYWVNKDRIDLLDDWWNFFYSHGRLPGSQELILVPHAEIPNFVKTNKALSPIDLYRKLNGTDARALVSIHTLAALDIYYGGNSYISKECFGEFLHNLTFQALTKDNDNVLLEFDKVSNLVMEVVNVLMAKNESSIRIAEAINENIRNEIRAPPFNFDGPSEIMDVDKPQTSPPAYQSPLPLTDEEIRKIYEKKKGIFKNSNCD